MDCEEIITLHRVDSTNSWLRRLIDGADAAIEVRHGLAVTARRQEAGRGQRGNAWESAPECNLTFSILLHPEGIHPTEQFAISEAVALATLRTAAHFLDPETASQLRIKWPNDIYAGNDKLAGILIENILSGSNMEWCICGIGLNVNQREFAWAPNAVSLSLLSGRSYDVAETARKLRSEIMTVADEYLNDARNLKALTSEYRRHLWRGEGYHPYIDKITGEHITAAIHDISPEGPLTLRLADGTLRTYSFKEVVPLLPNCVLKN